MLFYCVFSVLLFQECQRDLASVLPALKKAIESLETLDKASISEIRVYMNPPYLVLTVLNAVCVLFQKKADWPTAKMMLGDPNFLKKLLQFDKNSLPDKVFNRFNIWDTLTANMCQVSFNLCFCILQTIMLKLCKLGKMFRCHLQF